MTDYALTPLCIIPKDAWVQADWTSIGCGETRPRKVHACLMNIFEYCDGKPASIVDWVKAEKEFGIMVDLDFTYDQLSDLLSQLAPQEQGLFAYSGDTSDSSSLELPCRATPRGTHLKMCWEEPYPIYGAAYASSLSQLRGFDPDVAPGCRFSLGWFPEDDPVGGRIVEAWNNWPDSRCQAMLPGSPSPSDGSVELVQLGGDTGVICIFAGESLHLDLSPSTLRRVLGEDAILATIDRPDFWEWLEDGFRLEDLSPVDRNLPFLPTPGG